MDQRDILNLEEDHEMIDAPGSHLADSPPQNTVPWVVDPTMAVGSGLGPEDVREASNGIGPFNFLYRFSFS